MKTYIRSERTMTTINFIFEIKEGYRRK